MIQPGTRLPALLLVILAVLLAGCNAASSNAAGQTPGAMPSASPTQAETANPPGPAAQTPTAGPRQTAPADAPVPTPPANYVLYGTGNSTVEQAHAQLLSQGDRVYLIIVSPQSTGLEADIYQDLIRRNFRATVGPDEGIDTHAEFCYPDCVFVPVEAVNAIVVSSWRQVLAHEYRHITQARNNPTMAQDFRGANGEFTSYAAFSEACADYGLNVAPVYQAQARMDGLRGILGTGQQDLIDQACRGEKSAYQQIVDQYNLKAGQNGAFQQLFPPYE